MPSRKTLLSRLDISGRLCLILAFLLSVAAPVTADWLALRDGTRLETDGRWQVDKGVVKFNLPNRSGLFSVGVDQVDLAGSEKLTREHKQTADRGAAAKPTAPPTRREPVLVLTDRDVRKVKREPSPQVETGEPPGSPAADGEAPVDPPRRLRPGLEIVKWQQSESPQTGAVVIEGELRNTGRGLAIGLELTVSLTAGDGAVVASSTALLSASTLAPLQRSRFRAEFPGRVDFDEVEFEMEPRVVALVRILGPHHQPAPGPGAAALAAAS